MRGLFSGESQLTDRHPPLVIPAGCYDCGDGFYDPATRVVTTYDGDFLRNAGEAKGPKVTRHEPHLSGHMQDDATPDPHCLCSSGFKVKAFFPEACYFKMSVLDLSLQLTSEPALPLLLVFPNPNHASLIYTDIF